MKEFFGKLFEPGFASAYFGEPFQAFSWRDALDIVCLAALFFALYLFVRDRRAGKLLFGVALVAIIYTLGVVFDLYGIRRITGALFGFGCLALVVIFQPELRAALERLGSFFSGGFKAIGVESRDAKLTPAAFDAIVDAVKQMSLSQTGALIVLERSTKLGEYIHTGTILNAEITSELLRAVFFDKAPLHDGAVIIRDGRLFAAGCYLPLTDKNDISKELGTRHRAAIGLSEESDAVVIVVSEETGTVSIAYKGELYREFNSITLRRKLTELLGKQQNGEV